MPDAQTILPLPSLIFEIFLAPLIYSLQKDFRRKKKRMSGESGWKLYYWGGKMKGRGEYARLMFVLGNVDFEEINQPDKILPLVDRSGLGNAAYPSFAVPLVISPEGYTLSQSGAIMAYLGKRFGFYPENDNDEFHAIQIMNSVADFHSEGRSCFHPVDNMASYYTQVAEAEVAAKKFASTRLLVWLNHFNHLLQANSEKSGYLLGKNMTYADVAVYHVLSAAAFQFPEAWEAADFPDLKEFVRRIGQIPRLADYLSSPKAKPFEGNSMM
jgi:glutathione S-transferase